MLSLTTNCYSTILFIMAEYPKLKAEELEYSIPTETISALRKEPLQSFIAGQPRATQALSFGTTLRKSG